MTVLGIRRSANRASGPAGRPPFEGMWWLYMRWPSTTSASC
ncbi:hypothetical protein I553_0088 [Mycobacterium xenopi 4042]|uniref:Uncharacterized protein n=1 Tax=Mycobacterium xenopi 4042 TaxID=1299334 RepID=X7YK91_MYCXE|nr:hypothetical protein I553_0088 [Mycobacterium xenopi 4042]